MAPIKENTILEESHIAPPPGTTAEFSLPLSFFDMFWLDYHLFQRIMFYEFPCSATHFVESIAPAMKASLSITLKHFLPIAGNLIYPSDSSKCKPEIRYVTGDSVNLTFAVCYDDNFSYLSGYFARDADKFYPLLPKFPKVENLPDCKKIPLIALQVTLFPNRGICIGSTHNHVIGDLTSIVGFMRAWTSVHRLGGEDHLLAGNFLPFYDRTVIKDPCGLETILMNEMEKATFKEFPVMLPTNKVRATYVINEDQIKKLKNLVLLKKPSIPHVTAFSVTCAYVWTCLVKSSAAIGETGADDGIECFICAVNCRARLDPPAPANYFGNCLAPCLVRSTRTELIGNEGFLTAAEVIGDGIQALIHGEDGILGGAEKWVSKLESYFQKPILGVAGSPKYDVYDADFGWGKPKKFESVSIDIDGDMFLNRCRDSQGDSEVTLSLQKIKMDAFATAFEDGLKIL